MKQRIRRVRPVQTRGAGGMSGRDGAIDFAARTAAMTNVAAVSAEDHTYRVIELVGTSDQSIEDAITSAVARASKTLRNLRWFEVVRTSGHISDGTVAPLPGDAEGRLHHGRAGLEHDPTCRQPSAPAAGGLDHLRPFLGIDGDDACRTPPACRASAVRRSR